MWSKCHSKYGGVTRQLVLFLYGAHFKVFRFVFFSVFSLLSIFFCFICFCCCYFVIFYWTLKKTNWKNHWEWEVNKTEKQCICVNAQRKWITFGQESETIYRFFWFFASFFHIKLEKFCFCFQHFSLAVFKFRAQLVCIVY